MLALLDLSKRQGIMAITGGDDSAVLEQLWARRRSLFEHLAQTAEHFWVAESDGEISGYGYIGHRSGPFALLDDHDYLAVLAHAEATAASSGEEFGIEVPMLNTTAVDYLLQRGYQVDSFIA